MIHFAIGAAVPVMSRRPGVWLTNSNKAAHRVTAVVTMMRCDERIVNPFWLGAVSGLCLTVTPAFYPSPGLCYGFRADGRLGYLRQDVFNRIKRLS
jgi:hypothetical protein